MCKNKIHKIVKDLKSNKNKTIILALMYIPKLPSEEYEKKEELSELIAILNDFQSSNNPDISYLSRKARNFFSTQYFPQFTTDKSEANLMEFNNSKALVTRGGIEFKVSDTDNKNILNSINSNNFLDFLNHSDERVRAEAVEQCEQYLPAGQLYEILSPLLNDSNNRVRANAIIALKNLGSEVLSKFLHNMLLSPEIGMRESAIWAISNLYHDKIYLKLLMTALYDPYRDIRVRTIEVLKNYPCDEVITQMKRLSTDADSLISQKAEETLSFFLENQTNPRTLPLDLSKDITDSICDSSKDSININANFLDLSETTEKSDQQKRKTMPETIEIARKIVLHQKLASIDVEEFFDTASQRTNRNIQSDIEVDHTTCSQPTSDILDWIPQEYQPDEYRQNQNINLRNLTDKPSEANTLRKKIRKLLKEVGSLHFKRLSKLKSPGQKSKTIISKITFVEREIEKIRGMQTLKSDRRKVLIEQLQRNSEETLIFLGRAKIRQYNHEKYKCNIMLHYQKELRLLVDRLAKLD